MVFEGLFWAFLRRAGLILHPRYPAARFDDRYIVLAGLVDEHPFAPLFGEAFAFAPAPSVRTTLGRSRRSGRPRRRLRTRRVRAMDDCPSQHRVRGPTPASEPHWNSDAITKRSALRCARGAHCCPRPRHHGLRIGGSVPCQNESLVAGDLRGCGQPFAARSTRRSHSG